jgi:hypothetical protein
VTIGIPSFLIKYDELHQAVERALLKQGNKSNKTDARNLPIYCEPVYMFAVTRSAAPHGSNRLLVLLN